MGVKVTMKDYKAFFSKVIDPQTADLVESLVTKHGLEVMISFFGVQFQKNGKLIAGCSLNTNTSNLMKGTTPPEQKTIAVQMILNCISAAQNAVENSSEIGGVIKPDKPATKLGELLKEMQNDPAVKVAESKKQPLPTVIPLKEAQVLMQPVRGTSANSKYYAVALSEKVKVAYRCANKTLSIRVEGDIPKITQTRLSGIGFTNNGNYMSLHMEIGTVEVGQVLGGLLMRMGVSFDEMVMNYQELK